MSRRIKLFSSLPTLALSSALALTACGSEGESAEDAGGSEHQALIDGEFEGGESEGASVISGEKPSYIAHLILIGGHLKAGTTLYEAGDPGMAAMHMKHPQDELYADLLPIFSKFGAKEFDAELNALAAAVKGGEPGDIVVAAFRDAKTAVNNAIVAADPSIKEILLAVVQVLQTAGEEFDIGIASDGSITNIHEYQDAFGVMVTATELLTQLDGSLKNEKAAIAVAREQAVLALAAAPSPLPADIVTTKSSIIYSAAARIEVAALGL